MPSIKSEKDKAWLIYSSWRVGPSFCPALKSNVLFTLKGWNHLVRPGGMSKRTPGDLYRRLKILRFAKEIVEKSTTIQGIKIKNGINYFVLESVEQVMDKGLKEFKKIRVIIYKDKAENYKFLSVMPKKTE
jgi:uncharacterized protein YlzI (FlbEa/FlbD family)